MNNTKLYAVAVTVTERKDNGNVSRQIPTFLLDANTHGILNVGHAHKIARSIVNPLNLPNIETNVCAVSL